MPNDYATLLQLKAALPDAIPSTDTNYDALLTDLLTRASRLIDRENKWHAGAYSMPSASSDEETRYYNGSGCNEMYIDAIVAAPSAVGLSVGGGVASSDYSTVSATDYFLWPDNAAADGLPYTRLDLDFMNGAYSTWYSYRRGVKVTAVFGHSVTANTPKEITQATLTQAARWFGRTRQGFHGSGANNALGTLVYTGGLDDDVKMLIDLPGLKRVSI